MKYKIGNGHGKKIRNMRATSSNSVFAVRHLRWLTQIACLTIPNLTMPNIEYVMGLANRGNPKSSTRNFANTPNVK